jgi:hypothetical protein
MTSEPLATSWSRSGLRQTAGAGRAFEPSMMLVRCLAVVALVTLSAPGAPSVASAGSRVRIDATGGAAPRPTGGAGVAPTPRRLASLVDVTGRYQSNWDEVRLVQDGDRVRGTYVCCGGGVIEGRLRGRTLTYRWTQPGAEGRGVWSVREDGRLDGTWGHAASADDGGDWNLTRAGRDQQLAN